MEMGLYLAFLAGFAMVFGFCVGLGIVVSLRIFLRDEWGRNVFR